MGYIPENGAASNRDSIGKSWTRNSTFCMLPVFPYPDIQIQGALADQSWGVVLSRGVDDAGKEHRQFCCPID